MASLKITTTLLAVMLVPGSLRSGASAAPSAPAPEDPELLNSVFEYHGFDNNDARNAFWHDLETGDARDASQVLESNIAPAYSTGEIPLSVDLISNVVTQAAVNLTTKGTSNTTINQQVYENTFAQLPQIALTNRSILVQGFAEAIAQTMADQGSAGNMGPNLSGPLLALAYAAGLDDVFVVAFSAAKARGTSAADLGVLLSTLGGFGQPNLPAAATAAAIGVYGVSPVNLAQAQGNTTAIGALLLGSASLEGNSPDAAQNLSGSVQTANLSAQSQQEAFAQAILQGVQHLQTDASPSPNSTAVLIDAALIAQEANAVPEAFSQAVTTPLQLFCQVQIAAASLSSAAGQAASSAIPGSLGSDPCAQASMYLQTHSLTGPQTSCASVASSTYGPTATGRPSKGDCLAAASQLQGQGSNSCVVPNATATSPLSEYLTTTSGSLSRSGSCQIIIGGGAGSSLPCSQVATYANDLASVCSSTQMATGAVFYPDGFHFFNSTFVALTT